MKTYAHFNAFSKDEEFYDIKQPELYAPEYGSEISRDTYYAEISLDSL